jgi:hypothetical protein
MIRRLQCWLNGHDYVFAFGNRLGQTQLLEVTVCAHCGARHIAEAVLT